MKDKKSKEEISTVRRKIKLGLLGKSLLVRGEDKRKFEELKVKVLKEILPITEIETILCSKFIIAVWRHKRIVEIEKNMLSSQNAPDIPKRDSFDYDPYEFEFGQRREKTKKRVRNIKKLRLNSPDLQELMKYETALQKNMLKILEHIRKEQKARKDIVRRRVG
jgi:hypothetical protein